MNKVRFTSPGMLLVIATALAGGIVLLDVAFLQPYVAGQRLAALREEAVKVQRRVRGSLQGHQNALLASCASVASSAELPAMLAGETVADSFPAYAAIVIAPAGAELAWLTDETGKTLSIWMDAKPRRKLDLMKIDKLIESVKVSRIQKTSSATGIGELNGTPVLFATHSILNSQTKLIGRLWMAKVADQAALKDIGQASGCELVLVASKTLPKSTSFGNDGSHSAWLTRDDLLAVAWLADDISGKPMGYFRANLPVVQIHHQAVIARRIVLIILTLSLGLVLLIIMGMHILITGPVLRLLKRLQGIDSTGQGQVSKLTHDLHGEPLIIARRLESAFEKLAHISKTDQLTGLANRRHFEEVLECFYYQSRRYNRPLSLMMMDIDFFKAVNDAGGHQAGDELLKHIATSIEQVCRKADLPARLGGDEFAVLMPETTVDAAKKVALRMLNDIPQRTIEAGELQMNVTISIGLADLNAGEINSSQTMLMLADRALYAAKEGGRNRVFLAQDIESAGSTSHKRESRQVDVLCKKLAGLDTEFKNLFLHAVQEVIGVLEQRDSNMADHARKVQRYTELISRELGLPERVIQRVRVAAMLHDIGMLAMPDTVLLHPGGLDENRLRNMRRHPLLSVQVMERMEFLEQEIPAVRYHHERYDGTGYPEGLAGAAIPLTARILSVADTFDAMTSRRTFRDAKSREAALSELKLVAGTQLDPAIVNALVAVAEKLGDSLMDFDADDEGVRPQWRDAKSSENVVK